MHRKMGVNIVWNLYAVLLLAIQAMGIPKGSPIVKIPDNGISKKNRSHSHPYNNPFKLSTVPTAWPTGSGFASGIMDLGGLQVSLASTFSKIWGAYEGGPDNQGAAVYESTGIPKGFSMLGTYSQPNNKPLFGWIFVAKDVSSRPTNGILKPPIGYTLVWNTASLKVTQDSPLYVWLPIAPNGYKALGHVVTTTVNKPSLDKIKCVREDFTDTCEATSLIWGSNDFNFYDVRPSIRGDLFPGIRVGTFVAQNGGPTNPPSISCLKNRSPLSKSMPNLQQIEAILQAYSPLLYLHPDEKFLPSSVNWFFSNGARLYKKGQESNPIKIAPNGTNLPQDPHSDAAYWIDLPANDANKERVKKGDMQSAESYVNVKSMYGGTFTDLAMWVFYPFNGPGRVKVKFFDVALGEIGEHVGDWEHVTLRVSNLDGQLWHVYFSQHAHGQWLDSSQLEYQTDSGFDFPTRRPVVYSSLRGHASYPHAGLVLLGKDGVGVRDDCAKGSNVMDMGKYVLINVKHLEPPIVGPPWVYYYRNWGPHKDTDLHYDLMEIENALPGELKTAFRNIIKHLPREVMGQDGPSGPLEKNSWSWDEA